MFGFGVVSRWFEGTVTDKTAKQRGWWIWKKVVYILDLKVSEAVPSTHSVEVFSNEYDSAYIGKPFKIRLHQLRSGEWISSRKHSLHLHNLEHVE